MMTMSWHKCLYYYIATFHRNATQRCTVHANWTATIWRRSGKITQNSEHQNKLRLSLNTRKRFSANAQKIICSGSESKKRAKLYGKEIIKRKFDKKNFVCKNFALQNNFFIAESGSRCHRRWHHNLLLLDGKQREFRSIDFALLPTSMTTALWHVSVLMLCNLSAAELSWLFNDVSTFVCITFRHRLWFRVEIDKLMVERVNHCSVRNY